MVDTYKLVDLETINSLVQQCKRCKISTDVEVNIRSTNSKNGKLILNHKFENVGAKKILFVGANPSVRRFDTKIRAFEGVETCEVRKMTTSGGLFTQAMIDSGINKHDVFITNLVKCSTQKNREPTYLEIKSCCIFLIDEIRILDPDVIVALGASVSKWLTDLGIRHKKTWHPSAVLRAKSRYETYVNKLKELSDELSSSI